MATDVIRFWTFLMRTENSVTRVYYNGYDKNDNYINSYVDLSQVITNSGFTDTYKLEHFILPAINSVVSDISLTLPVNDYMISSDTESRSYYVGSLSNNSSLSQCKLLSVTLKQTVEHLDTGNVDYTQVLTDINTNLTNLNTNITNKNNQSDIVDCLKLIFVNRISGVESSVMKVNTDNDSIKTTSSIPALLFNLCKLLSSDPNYGWASQNYIANRALDNISKKLCYLTPTQNSDNNSIFRILRIIALSLSKDSNVNLSNDSNVVASASLREISDKLANSNDLHTISQAIDLITSAIAQGDQSQELGAIKDSIDNLHLEQNNLIQVEGVLDYRLKPTDAE